MSVNSKHAVPKPKVRASAAENEEEGELAVGLIAPSAGGQMTCPNTIAGTAKSTVTG